MSGPSIFFFPPVLLFCFCYPTQPQKHLRVCLQWSQPTGICMAPVGGFVMDGSDTFSSLATWWSCYEKCERANLQPNQESGQSAGLRPPYTLLTRIHAKHPGDQWVRCKTSVWEKKILLFQTTCAWECKWKNVAFILFSFNSGWFKVHELGALKWALNCLQKCGKTGFRCPCQQQSQRTSSVLPDEI